MRLVLSSVVTVTVVIADIGPRHSKHRPEVLVLHANSQIMNKRPEKVMSLQILSA